MRVLIVDDEKNAREELRFLLEQHNNIQIIGEAENGFEAVKLCKELSPDAVFLDIQMPGKNGIEAAGEIISLSSPPVIVFQTAYDEYAIQAFEVEAADYLLKPVSEKRLEKVISRISRKEMNAENLSSLLMRLSQPEPDTPKPVPVYSGDAIIPLKQDEIIFIEARGKHCRIISKNGEYNYSGAFYQLEEKITHPDFCKCHRSFLINTSYILKVDLWFNNTYMISLTNTDEKIPVSRGKMDEFKKRIGL